MHGRAGDLHSRGYVGPNNCSLERMTLSSRLVFPIMDQIQVSWLLGGQGTGPPPSRDT